MRVLNAAGLARAEQFLRLNGRAIDRRRFALHFRGGRGHSRFPTGSPARSRTSCAKWAWSA